MKKTDTQLRQDVIDELEWLPSIAAGDIAVAAKDGVVTLSGAVASYAQKHAAERAVERLAGVKALANDLAVLLPSRKERTDTAIAHSVVAALTGDIEVPDDKIRATVDKGWVTLDGDVQWQSQRGAADRAVRYPTGVKGLRDFIAVKAPHVSSTEVGKNIKSAMHRSAEFDARNITVDALGVSGVHDYIEVEAF